MKFKKIGELPTSKEINTERMAKLAKDADWKESEHKRADNGQFGSGGASKESDRSKYEAAGERLNQLELAVKRGELPTTNTANEASSMHSQAISRHRKRPTERNARILEHFKSELVKRSPKEASINLALEASSRQFVAATAPSGEKAEKYKLAAETFAKAAKLVEKSDPDRAELLMEASSDCTKMAEKH